MSRFDLRIRKGEIFNILNPIIYDPDASAFFSRVTAAGGSLTLNEQVAVNKLVIDLKSNGLWNLMRVVYPMVGSSSAACSQNLIISSYNGTFTAGWTYSSSGVLPNGTSAYMNTSFVHNQNYQVSTNGHLAVYLNTNNTPSTSDPVDMGAYNSLTQAITTSPSVLNMGVRNMGNTISGTQTTRLGFTVNSKTSATVTTLYKNGVSIGTGNSGGTVPSLPVFLGTLNYQGNPYSLGYTNNRIAFASIGDGLDATQAANLYTAVQDFQTSLGRQV